MNIVDCGIIEYTNVGGDLIGKPRNVHNIKGDGNCYFRCISYTLSGSEDYYDIVRKVLCKYISWFPGKLQGLITDKDELENESKYMKQSKMRNNGTWATEIEILATAKCFRRDIFTYLNDKWVCHSYLAEFSEDAIYLLNENHHFNFVLGP